MARPELDCLLDGYLFRSALESKWAFKLCFDLDLRSTQAAEVLKVQF